MVDSANKIRNAESFKQIHQGLDSINYMTKSIYSAGEIGSYLDSGSRLKQLSSVSNLLSSSKGLNKFSVKNIAQSVPVSHKPSIIAHKKTTNLNRMQRRSVQRLIETLQTQSGTSIRNGTQSVVQSQQPTQPSRLSQVSNCSSLSFYQQKNREIYANNQKLRCKTPFAVQKISIPINSQKRSTVFPRKVTTHQTPSSQKKRCELDDGSCLTWVYKANLCRTHFSEQLSRQLRQKVHQFYKDPDTAFSALNPHGLATISLQDFLNHSVMTHFGHAKDDVKSYLLREKVFPSEKGEIDFTRFKKFFFPQLMLIEQDAEKELEKKEESTLEAFNKYDNDGRKGQKDPKRPKMALDLTKVKQQTQQYEKQRSSREAYVRERLSKLNNFLREKFQDTWVSVRKAFLDLDVDKDGEISPEDIMRFFGDAGHNLFDYYDLVKILEDLDSQRSGRINYPDFCRWMGGAIHKSEGFLFRHDSIKNPPQEAHMAKAKDVSYAKPKMTSSELQYKFGKKMEFQWKTLQGAFKSLNLSKSGKIQRWELKYFMDHWGFEPSAAQFDEIFKVFDVDQDGEISYQDLQKAFGSVLNPPEAFYFRQDLMKQPLNNVCQEAKCSFIPVGYHSLCLMHYKKLRMKSMTILGKVKDKVTDGRWNNFLDKLRIEMSKVGDTDCDSIEYSLFLEVLRKNYGVELSGLEQETLIKTFSAKSADAKSRKINLKPIMQLNNHQQMINTYKNIQFRFDDCEDMDEVDTAGYFGTNHRLVQKFSHTFTQLHDIGVVVRAIHEDNKLVKIFQTIRSIDMDKNGYITNQELEDILKLHYPVKLKEYDLKPLFKKFASQSNRLLISYAMFKEAMLKELRKLDKRRVASVGAMTDRGPQFIVDKLSPFCQKTAAGVPQKRDGLTVQDTMNCYVSKPAAKPLQSTKNINNVAAQLLSPRWRIRKVNTVMASQKTNLRNHLNSNMNLQERYQNNTEIWGSLRSPSQKTLSNNEPPKTPLEITKLSSQKQTFGMLNKKFIDKAKYKRVTSTLDKDTLSTVSGLSKIHMQLGYHQNRKTNSGFVLPQRHENPTKPRRKLQSDASSREVSVITNGSRCQSSKNNLREAMHKSPYQRVLSGDSATKMQFRNAQRSTEIGRCLLSCKQTETHLSDTLNTGSRTLDAVAAALAKRRKRMVSEVRSNSGMRNSSRDNQLRRSSDAVQSVVAQSQAAVSTGTSKERLSNKLRYEWKNIFRSLRQHETFPKGHGLVTRDTFETILHQHDIQLTRYDFTTLTQLFRQNDADRSSPAVIDYIRMSRELGLHSSKLMLIQPSLARQDIESQKPYQQSKYDNSQQQRQQQQRLPAEMRSSVSASTFTRLRRTLLSGKVVPGSPV